MIETVIHPRNMQQACIQVMQNKGSAGVDRMPVTALKDFVRKNRGQIAEAMKKGNYSAQPILGGIHTQEQWKDAFIGYSNGNRPLATTMCGTGDHAHIRSRIQTIQLWFPPREERSPMRATITAVHQ